MKKTKPNHLVDSVKENVKQAFAGLSTQYYTRQAIIGLGIALVMLWVLTPKHVPMLSHVGFIAGLLINAALYPYARFGYEEVRDYLVGENEVIANPMMRMLVKAIMMLLCFNFALFLAPIVLIYLYLEQADGDDMMEKLHDMLGRAKEVVVDTADTVKGKVQDLVDDSDAEELTEKAKDKATKVKDKAKSKAKDVAEDLEDEYEDFEDEDEDEEDEDLVEKVKEKAARAKRKVKATAEKIKNKITDDAEDDEDLEDEEDFDDEDEDEAPKKTRRKKPVKKVVEDDEDDVEDEEDDEDEDEAPRRRRRK